MPDDLSVCLESPQGLGPVKNEHFKYIVVSSAMRWLTDDEYSCYLQLTAGVSVTECAVLCHAAKETVLISGKYRKAANEMRAAVRIQCSAATGERL